MTAAQEAFQTIQFDAQDLSKHTDAVLRAPEEEKTIRDDCEAALIMALEAINEIENIDDPSQSNLLSYANEFEKLISILRDGEIGTRGLMFHVNQKMLVAQEMSNNFAAHTCSKKLKHASEKLRMIKAQLLSKLNR